jgi:hypothetical protein
MKTNTRYYKLLTCSCTGVIMNRTDTQIDLMVSPIRVVSTLRVLHNYVHSIIITLMRLAAH